MIAVPPLNRSCGSWIAEAPAGHAGYRGSRYVEVWTQSDAEKLAAWGWTVRTALDHLVRLAGAEVAP